MTMIVSTRLSDFARQGESGNPLSSPFKKNISVFPKCKSGYVNDCSTPLEGRVAIVTNAGWNAVDAEAPITNGGEADGEVVWS
jgi:hypothetical protein